MSERSKKNKNDPWEAAEGTVSTTKNGRGGGARPSTADAVDKAGTGAQKAPNNSNSRGGGVAVSRKRKAGRMSSQSEVKLSSHGGHLLLFQDDSTGRKRINVSALRLVLGIIQDETAETIRTAAAELMDKNEKEDNRRVQVRARSHVHACISETRRQLAEVKVPERYVKIEDSLKNAVDLEKMNALRRHEIKSSNEIGTRLEHDLSSEKDRLSEIQARKDRILKQLSADEKRTDSVGREETNHPATPTTHRLIQNEFHDLSQERHSGNSALRAITSRTEAIQHMTPGRHPKESLMRWLVGSNNSAN
mmetsp:Transcript_6769/g.14787  ORF Transcript_6769/g.14787 Transcript_6769/m.14787 type:complete len:306 (-) Transcript_6769:170-1087(-)|eukprot:CAMPEP_0178511114 /NCGR_PEP_ID=MMETSP0696-20121128/22198_1 /TAXON_ID=265572 /ORGANISM="Extubocellulus spinifer, Strain CCMP396" /LENGTH=305 /DNA_ID=CAMNT_0020140883 /DNA_START=44 /DNA_END=961 /DNA_ORIENTATION=-